MKREDVEFKTSDGVSLRGWFYSSDLITDSKAPCIVLCIGLGGTKEMSVERFAEYFVAHLPVNCLLYDHRSWGASDTLPGCPRNEADPMVQSSDLSDAISYVSTLDRVDPQKIGIWGSSYGGGHCLYVGAVDKRVKLVLSQIPLVDGYATTERALPEAAREPSNAHFAQDRLARAQGKEPQYIAVSSADPATKALFNDQKCFDFFKEHVGKPYWDNRMTVKTVELSRGWVPAHLIDKISPTPLHMTVAIQDTVTPAEYALKAYNRALEPKKLTLLNCDHFGPYSGPHFEKVVAEQAAFIKEWFFDGQ
ncbi:uncharacterized protein PgNI_09233 [Pyricularia grisea]|uniref:AB hydrolase-1 domain-containing protein n=1 Tax=Pyricularia grisea TaxID=148305 RepID=A0A6P8ATJ8_PYRGI|nr:uncharacterized protein PgNI_09233 [Pyricularia grisea]TLD05440.1 hypothetical protein PgNI_09233 [Pyricularia grisea]